jgi:DNA adenine methylase
MFQPVIKWSGSKRSQSSEILKHFPKKIGTYYEPFCGGASILRALIQSDIQVDKYICSDINKDLINLWMKIKLDNRYLAEQYEFMWHELNIDNDLERKKNYFYKVRERYNRGRQPEDFLFIMRTTTNGMPRYNQEGNFNNSFHVTRNGIEPRKLKAILSDWSWWLNYKDVIFVDCSYDCIYSCEDDFLYLDPPYAQTKGMYYGTIDYQKFWAWLKLQEGQYCFSFDGRVKEQDMTYNVPKEVYSNHLYLNSGNSSFRRVIGKSNDSVVYESLYIK